jgi:all-trans-retinol 13,14-reductase
MDDNGFDEIILHDKSYLFANGYERFAETLSEQFPHQRENLRKYTGFLQNVSENIFTSFTPKSEDDLYGTSLFAQSAYDYLTSTIDDPLLRQVLSGASLKMELNPETLPLYIFAQINSSFIQSAWRLRGGGMQIADTLIKQIEAHGGTVRMKAEVSRLVEESGKIVAAEVNQQERIEANHFISNVHPAVTLALITESKLIRNIYRKRISNLENTFGMFTVNIALKDNSIPYQNRNIYVYKISDVWQYADYKPEHVNTCVLVSFQPPEAGSSFTRNIDILTPMYRQEVASWEATRIGRRGDDYLSYKNQKAEACIRLASEHIPCLSKLPDAIERYFTSASLTWRDYTGTPYGAAYGIRKDYNQLMTTLLSPRTPVPNLLLTGQNLNLHGILGVSMTSFLTCAEIIGLTNIKECKMKYVNQKSVYNLSTLFRT